MSMFSKVKEVMGISSASDSASDTTASKKADHCCECGAATARKASFYLGTPSKEDPSQVSWELMSMGLCDDCLDAQVRNERFMPIVYLALQVCWVVPLTHGLTPLGIGASVIAGFSLFELVARAAGMLWSRSHGAKGSPSPSWMRMPRAPEEVASEFVARKAKEQLATRNYLVESLAAHQQTHAVASEKESAAS